MCVCVCFFLFFEDGGGDGAVTDSEVGGDKLFVCEPRCRYCLRLGINVAATPRFDGDALRFVRVLITHRGSRSDTAHRALFRLFGFCVAFAFEALPVLQCLRLVSCFSVLLF